MNRVLTLKKPLNFEGKEYTEIDLSELDELTTRQLKEADKLVDISQRMLTMKEVTLDYACVVAHISTHLPLEFFDQLSAVDAVSLRIMVVQFFFG